MGPQVMGTFAGLLTWLSEFPSSCQKPCPSEEHSFFLKSVPLSSFPLKQIFQLGKHAYCSYSKQEASQPGLHMCAKPNWHQELQSTLQCAQMGGPYWQSLKSPSLMGPGSHKGRRHRVSQSTGSSHSTHPI